MKYLPSQTSNVFRPVDVSGGPASSVDRIFTKRWGSCLQEPHQPPPRPSPPTTSLLQLRLALPNPPPPPFHLIVACAASAPAGITASWNFSFIQKYPLQKTPVPAYYAFIFVYFFLTNSISFHLILYPIQVSLAEERHPSAPPSHTGCPPGYTGQEKTA